MELHLFLIILASFLALLGVLMDLQSLFAGMKRLRSGRGARPVFYWPLLMYALAALAWDVPWMVRAEAFLVGLAIHTLCVSLNIFTKLSRRRD